MTDAKPLQISWSISSAVLESADIDDLQQIKSTSSGTEDQIQAVLIHLNAGQVDSAIQEAINGRAALERGKGNDRWHFVVRIGTRFRSFARSYGHAGAARFARIMAEKAILYKQDLAECQNRLGLALSTCADLTSDTQLHMKAAAAFIKAGSAFSSNHNDPDALMRYQLNKSSALLTSNCSENDLIKVALEISEILSAINTKGVYYTRSLELLALIKSSLASDQSAAQRLGIDLQTDIYGLIDKAVALSPLSDRFRPFVLQSASRLYLQNATRFYARAEEEINKADTYARESVFLLKDISQGPLPLSRVLMDLSSIQLQSSLVGLVKEDGTSLPNCRDAIGNMEAAMSLTNPGYSPRHWYNLNRDVSDELSRIIDYIVGFQSSGTNYHGSQTDEVLSLIDSFYVKRRLFDYGADFNPVPRGRFDVAYDVDQRYIKLAAYIRAAFAKEALPPEEWERVFQLALGGLAKESSTPPEFGNLNSTDLPRGAPFEESRRRRASLAIKNPLPALPLGYSWPVGDYGDSAEGRGREPGGIIAYLTRVWLPILEAGRRDGRIYVDRRDIAQHYPGVIYAINNFRKPNKTTGKRGIIPENLRFPSEASVNDHLLSIGIGEAVRKDPRLAQVVANRVRARRKVPGV